MLLLGDCNHWLKEIKDESIDLICTDPPYGIEFMGKDWDKALVPTETWKECYRVLKEGKLAFVMCSPRQDVLSRMIVNLQDAGFRTNYTSIYWTFASGFPKAANISKLIDKKAGAEREVIGINQEFKSKRATEVRNSLDSHRKRTQICSPEFRPKSGGGWLHPETVGDITKPATEEAKKMEGAYVGFQPKPAVEIILVVSKGKTLTWLDDCRIPYQSEDDKLDGQSSRKAKANAHLYGYGSKDMDISDRTHLTGRFPANLLVSDDVLNDGSIHKSGKFENHHVIDSAADGKVYGIYKDVPANKKHSYGDEGSYSRYFSLDAWSSCSRFPFLIVPKASASERNKGCESLEKQKGGIAMRQYFSDTIFVRKNEPDKVDVAVYLHSWRAKAGLSQGQIDELMGWNTMYSWLEGRKSGVSLTSPESWMKLKEILGFDDKFDKQMTELVEVDRGGFSPSLPRHNTHPTVKPLKLMSYLITMGSREGDLILDPFCGSGTVCIAAHQLHRKWLGIEMNPEYAEIIKKRLADPLAQLKLTAFA